MSRLSIELTSEQHKHVKAVAALEGKSIKEYVLSRVLPPHNEEYLTTDKALAELEAFLKPRVEEVEAGKIINQSVESIFKQVGDEIGKEME